MITYTAETTSDLLYDLTTNVLQGNYAPDGSRADRMYYYDLLLSVDKPKNDLDFGWVYWNAKRWQKFGKEYLSEQSLSDWLSRCVHKENGASDQAEIGYQFSRARGSKGHNLLGNCITGMTFHRKPTPRITLTSRVTNLLPVGFLELTLANLLAEKLTEELGTQVSLTWYITQLQFSVQWSFPYWYHQWLPYNSKRTLTHFTRTWVNRLEKRYKDLVSGRVAAYAYMRENRLYQRMNKKNSYFASLEDLDGFALL